MNGFLFDSEENADSIYYNLEKKLNLECPESEDTEKERETMSY